MLLSSSSQNTRGNQKIGLTGASGFIGSFLMDELQKNFSVLGLTRQPSQNPHLQVCADYGDVENLGDFLSQSDVLIHLANSSLPRNVPFSVVTDVQENLIKTLKLFEAYYQKRPDGRIIFFSTGGAIYKSKSDQVPYQESDCVDPESSYGNQKFLSENLLRLICQRKGFSASVLRVSNPYGILLKSERKQGLIGVAATCAIQEKEFSLFGRADLVRDYIHLSDVTSAVELIVKNSNNRKGFELFNLGSGTGHSTQEILDLISKLAPHPLKVNIEDHPSQEPLWNVLDISKFKAAYQWQPLQPFEQGIRNLFKLNPTA